MRTDSRKERVILVGVRQHCGGALKVPQSLDSDLSQMYELYSEIVYEIVNAVGRDAARKGGREALVSYLQEAFKIDSDKHALLLEKIKERKVKQNKRKMSEFYIRNNSVHEALRHKKL